MHGGASVFGATDAFAVGFVGKRFGVMARSLSEIAPVRSGGRNDEVSVKGRIPVDGTIRSFGGRLPVFSRLRAAGPAKPWGANAEARCIGERSNQTGLGGRQASSAQGRSGHLCRGRKGRNARSGFGGRMVCRGGVYARSFPPAGIGGLRAVRIVRGQRGFPVASVRKFRPISLGRRAPEFV